MKDLKNNLSIYIQSINEDLCTIEFSCGSEVLYSAKVFFDIQSEFWNEYNLLGFFNYIEELMEGKALNAENCHYALNLAVNEYDFCDYFEILFGYKPTLINRYSEN